ncbi:MAG: hypothetical protein Kow00117_09200 [Phototrophicales bacterium]
MEIYLIRHGQSTNNALMQDQHLRVEDPELTDVGHQQVQQLVDHLTHTQNPEELIRIQVNSAEREQRYPYQFTHIYSSAMYRAMQTAYPIAQAFNLPLQIWLDIHEQGGIFLKTEQGVIGYGGKTRSEIMAEFENVILPDEITESGWWDTTHGEEDLAGVYARAVRVSLELRARAQNKAHKDDKIALVSHGMFINTLLKALLDIVPSSRHHFWHNNTAFSRVDLLEGDILALRYTNRVSHLPPQLMT